MMESCLIIERTSEESISPKFSVCYHLYNDAGVSCPYDSPSIPIIINHSKNNGILLAYTTAYGYRKKRFPGDKPKELVRVGTGQGISLNGKVPFEILPEKRHIT